MEFSEYQKEGTITQLPQTEKEVYIKFHEQAYKDDRQVADKLLLVSPLWTIIAGYYAMHDMTKLFLAKNHIPTMLTKGRDEREKAQYYTEEDQKIIFNKSAEFVEKIMKPYLALMEKLLE